MSVILLRYQGLISSTVCMKLRDEILSGCTLLVNECRLLEIFMESFPACYNLVAAP